MNVTIIGAGRIGAALGKIIGATGHKLKIWDNNPAKNLTGGTLAETTQDADLLFLCVPSWAVRSVASAAKLFLKQKTIIVSLAKGLETDSAKTMDLVLTETLPRDQIFFILGGPMLAENIEAGGLGLGVAASKNKDAFRTLQEIFDQTNIQLEYSPNPRAVAWAGALKNIYAAAMGLADGLSWSENAKGWLAAKSLREMAEVSKIVCGSVEEITSTAGLGDFIATAYSRNSGNRSQGEALATIGQTSKKSEGLNSLPLLNQVLAEKANQFKILKTLTQVIPNPTNLKNIFESLLH